VSAPAVRRAYAEGRYGQVHYRIARPVAPATRPLVCFHLSPVSGVVYERFLASMGQDRVCVAPDTPGYGQSDPPPGPPSIADLAAALGGLIDSLGLGEVDLMGYHTGSKIAVELALQRPAQVRHLVLIAAPVYDPPSSSACARATATSSPTKPARTSWTTGASWSTGAGRDRPWRC